MENRNYLIILYDYYGELLDEDDKSYFEDYYFDNLSLAEVASNNNISRNAVHKHIKKVEEKLLFYEDKLKLYSKDKKIKEKIDKINNKSLQDLIIDLLNLKQIFKNEENNVIIIVKIIKRSFDYGYKK